MAAPTRKQLAAAQRETFTTMRKRLLDMAAQYSPSPSTDALIEREMAKHPGISASAQGVYYEAVHQELAPFARGLEDALRNLVAQIELATDCMTGTIDANSLVDWVEEAEEALNVDSLTTHSKEAT